MKRFLLLPFTLLLAWACCNETPRQQANPVDYVNILCGTLSKFELSTGNTYPAVAVPWGAHFWTPQTGKNGDGWTYRYDATRIRGLKQTHQPSPWINDYGAWSLMPVAGKPVYEEEQRSSWFSHKAEVATPYYYSVYLADYDITAELTPSAHAAALRVRYPKEDPAYLVVDAYKGGSASLQDPNTIVGYSVQNHGGVTENFHNWFVIHSDTPFELCGGDDCTLLVALPAGALVNLQAASSFISPEQAVQNLQEVAVGFDAVKSAARELWNDTLGRIEVQDDNLDHLRTFYSCLYRSLLFPRDLSELNAAGERVHYSPHNGKVEKGYFYTDTGFWDTFRSLFPLLNLVYPEVSARVQEGPGAGRPGERLSGKRLPARVGQPGAPRLHGG